MYFSSFNSYISVVVSSFFELGTVSKWCIRKWITIADDDDDDVNNNYYYYYHHNYHHHHHHHYYYSGAVFTNLFSK